MQLVHGGPALCEAAERWNCVPRVYYGKGHGAAMCDLAHCSHCAVILRHGRRRDARCGTVEAQDDPTDPRQA